MAEPNPDATRTYHKRRRVIFKRDYNREIEEVNRINKLTCTIENAEQMEAVRISMQKTRSNLDDTYMGLLDVLDPTRDDDKKFEEDLLKERDNFFLQLDRAAGVCMAYRKKLEGQTKRESLNASISNQTAAASAARLPKINVPKFNGDLRKFLDFKALFENLVHNDEDISPVRKMHYLKESLVDEAAKTLANMAISDEGYKEAWGRVLSKYDNKRIIIHTHFNDLFTAERIRTEAHLRSLLDRIDVALRGLRTCGEQTDKWSSILAYVLYVRLDNKTRADFDNTVTSNAAYLSYKDLMKFCEARASNIEARKIEDGPSPSTVSSASAPTLLARGTDPKRTFLASRITCVVCQGQHLIIECSAFAAKPPSERIQLIQAGNLCTNCFSRNHLVQACTSPRSCKICHQRHHHLLHGSDAPAAMPPMPHPRSTSSVASAPVTQARQFIVLPSAKVRFSCGRIVGDIRILLDNCSQATLLSDRFVRRLKLPTVKTIGNNPIRGVGFEMVGTQRSCSLTIASRFNNFQLRVEADVIPGAAIPYCVNSLQWNDRFREVVKYNLADTAFYSKTPVISEVDMILGAQHVEACLLNETVVVDKLVLRSTQFGWTLNGEFPTPEITGPPTSHLCCLTTMTIDAQLARFFEFEEDKTNDTSQEEFCESHYLANRTRAENGQFVVKLPFVQPPSLLRSTKRKAAAILAHCRARATPELWQGYSAFMAEYEKLHHMSPVNDRDEDHYVIPHHAVLKPDSTTTKIRVVFNASLKSSSGYSLNDVLAVGPQLQPDIFDALVRFRRYPVAFTGDIAMMYRCVQIHPDDRQHQKIVWQQSPKAKLQTYELNTITYGTAPASFLAVRCLRELAEPLQSTHPAAAQAILTHFYMDDLMTGAASVQQAIELRSTIQQTLAAAGFHLRKYQSNSAELLAAIPPELRLQPQTDEFGPTDDTAILGVGWNCESDTIKIKAVHSTLTSCGLITKRRLLSEISRVFDPLGLVAPVTVRAKLFVQRVWREAIGWDQPISAELRQEVLKYFQELPLLSDFAVPRAYSCGKSIRQELIGFCDASERAYCAMAYIKHTYPDNNITVRLICAKTRVAPIKATTIPRLELQGALLLTNLMQRLQTAFNLNAKDVTLYCDSQVVLAWLAKPSHSWTTFVRNRVQLINQRFSADHWYHTPSESNPADLATRGLRPSELLRSALWIQGPHFLHTAVPQQSPIPNMPSTLVEACSSKHVGAVVATHQPRVLIESFTSYRCMLSVLGRVIRFVQRWKAARPNQVKYNLNIINYTYCARTAAILLLQIHAFGEEIRTLRAGHQVKPSSPLRRLDPFLDDQGVLRVMGRLANTDYSYAKKHPIIIPRNSHFMKLYIHHLHNAFCHATSSFITCFISAEFWVCGGLHASVKMVLNACITCARYRAEAYAQIMGQLPRERAMPSRPFSHTGVDFCGPFSCRCVGHRSLKLNKIYACLFICTTTRAIHLEVVSNLTTTNFLLALHRFVARRGLPTSIRSDCGTNFVGAANYLNLEDSSIQQDPIVGAIQWTFNPPRSPHRGGLWEAAVKAAKSHLLRVVGQQVLNFEEYSTLFSRIEAILNSRPLCYRLSPTADQFILTPSHFLIGSLTYVIPEPEHSSLPLWKRYDLLRILLTSFWRMWRADYLNMLQRKEKWTTLYPNIAVGQLVLMKGDSPPGTWPFGVIEATEPDALGAVRTVTVRAANGSRYKRDLRSLVRVPVEPPHSSAGGSVVTTEETEEH